MTDHGKEAHGVGQEFMSTMIRIRACLQRLILSNFCVTPSDRPAFGLFTHDYRRFHHLLQHLSETVEISKIELGGFK